MTKISKTIVSAINDNIQDVEKLIADTPNWAKAENKFNTFYNHLANLNDTLWSDSTFKTLHEIYLNQRSTDKSMSNITIRTLVGMPDNLKNDTKKIFLQTAEVCCVFNASQKVNFSAEELPQDFDEIKMIPSKVKGQFTYSEKLPSLYKKTSLTFDYWIPKIFEWTVEIRNKGLKKWKGEEILQHESCTDFMRLSLMFLSDTKNNTPIAKAQDRVKLLNLLGEEFVWTKKSAKREDILGNNNKIVLGFKELNNQIGFDIPFEAWSRIFQTPYIKSIIK